MLADDFFTYQTQTSTHPIGMEISHAKGSYIYDAEGKEHLDFVAGVSACTLGHCHPEIVKAAQEQAASYMHVMVYGEYIQEPAVSYAKLLAEQLPPSLQTTYLVNSGTEAMEGALKLARKATERSEIIAAKNCYHGNTMGSLSLSDYEERRAPFLPLIPDIRHIQFNDTESLSIITERTAAVVLETIQGGAGFILPEHGYLEAVRRRCTETGTLLILDEIQPGFGRTGKLFAFEHYNCVPDILVLGKGMASGLPIGGFVASKDLMAQLASDPELGHITTFGGNAVIAAAAKKTLEVLLRDELIDSIPAKEMRFKELLQHELIDEVRGTGLMLSLLMPDAETASKLISGCADKGLILFGLLFENKAVRITPPLTISDEEITKGCRIILEILDQIAQ
ncbi:MAG: aspartate aminotransferase family protein [Eudoraea sp.]|nr:aspartate aminotransferase family protein [Eudoraea sp.]